MPKKPEYTEDDLRKAITELNAVFGDTLDEPLDNDADMDMDDLVESFKEGIEIANAEDLFSPETVAIAAKFDTELTVDPDAKKEKAPAKDTAATKEKPTKKKEETPDKKKKVPAKKEKAPASKKDTKKKPAKKEKAPAKDTAATKKKPAKEPTKKSDKTNEYTRSNALVDALKKGGSRKEIVALSDELYVKKGGKTNPNVANYMFGYVFPSLLIIGTITVDDDKVYSWAKK